MPVKIEVEIDNLSVEGIFGAASVVLQGMDLGQLDWNSTGRVIEQMGIGIRYREPFGDDDVRNIIGSKDGNLASSCGGESCCCSGYG